MKKTDLIKFARLLWEDGHMKTYYDDIDFNEYLRLIKEKDIEDEWDKYLHND